MDLDGEPGESDGGHRSGRDLEDPVVEVDPLDAIAFCEDRLVKGGFEDGSRARARQEAEEGFDLGVTKGREVALRAGSSRGFARTWLRILALKPAEKSGEKLGRALNRVVDLSRKVPEFNSTDADDWQNLSDLRAKVEVAKRHLSQREGQRFLGPQAAASAAAGLDW